MNALLVLRLLTYLGAVVLAGLGVMFLADPVGGPGLINHHPDKLAEVMGTRYLLMALLLAVALWQKAYQALIFLLVAYATLGVADAIIYLGLQPLPHLGAGIVSAIAAGLFYQLSKAKDA